SPRGGRRAQGRGVAIQARYKRRAREPAPRLGRHIDRGPSMLLLTFRAAGDSYAVAAREVVEIVPSIDLRPVPHAPAYLLGMFHYRGTVVPVVDLSVLMGAAPCRRSLDTRIIVVDHPGDGGTRAMLGLLAERVNDLQKVDDAQKISEGMPLPE